MAEQPKKSLMNNLGAFVGHIWKGIRTDPSKTEVRRSVSEKKDGDVTYRRTTIDEVIVHGDNNAGNTPSRGNDDRA